MRRSAGLLPGLFLWPLAAMVLLVPSGLLAQGQIIPRPCPTPPPPTPACRDGRCIDVAVLPCPTGNPIVRTSSTVHVDLGNRVLRYEISETFVNRGAGLGEADYIFPLPAGAAFEDLKLSINGELVSGETMNAGDARRIYEEIVRKRRDPALVEWMGSGLLRARIFPIQAGEEKRVVVRFQTVALREGSALRVDYVRGTDPASQPAPGPILREEREDALAGRAESPNTFTLSYPVTEEYGNPYSPTHTLRTSDRLGRRTITASGSGREVTILLPLRHANAASLTVLTHRDPGEDGFALITISPPSAPRQATPRDLTFVVDVSGSMRGSKLEQAKAAGRALLATLGGRDRFRIIDFSTDVRSFRDDFVPATAANLGAARRYLDDLVADGSTNISGALDAALDTPADGDRLPLVVFVTDGEPTVGERNPDAIAARAARRRGTARLFSVGVSAEVNSALIEQLAIEGHGTAQFVRSGESVERAVSLLASRLTTPVLTDLRVIADGVRLSRMQPSLPLDLFAGQDLILLARYDGTGEAHLRVEAREVTGTVSWTATAQFPGRERNNAFIPRLWAAQRLGWLAAEKRRNGGTSELDAEIKSLGERYGIPTEFSSYLVVEPGQQVVTGHANAGGANRPQPVPMTAGVRLRDVRTAANEVQFEEAKKAAVQRAATSLAQVDSVSATGAMTAKDGQRQIGERRFALQDGVWIDQRYTPSQRIVRVKSYSPLYFDLVNRLPGLSEVLVLGDQMVVVGRNVALRFGPDGAESLSDREMADLVRAW